MKFERGEGQEVQSDLTKEGRDDTLDSLRIEIEGYRRDIDQLEAQIEQNDDTLKVLEGKNSADANILRRETQESMERKREKIQLTLSLIQVTERQIDAFGVSE
jgi:hypothetical protein